MNCEELRAVSVQKSLRDRVGEDKLLRTAELRKLRWELAHSILAMGVSDSERNLWFDGQIHVTFQP